MKRTKTPFLYDGNPKSHAYYEDKYLDLNPSLHHEDAESKFIVVRNALSRFPKEMQFRTIADIGCGSCAVVTRVLTYLIERNNPNIFAVGIDISRRILAVGEVHQRLVKLRADATDLPLEDNAITLCICLDIVEHIVHPQFVLKEVSRVSEFAVFKIPLEISLYTWFKGGRRRLEELEQQFGHIQHFNKKSLLQLIVRNFDILDICYEKIPRRSWPIDRIQEIMLRLGMNDLFASVFGGFIVILAGSKRVRHIEGGNRKAHLWQKSST